MSSSNSSVQDALNLAWKLALVHKGLSPVTPLDAYTTERLPVIAEMLHLTTGSFHKLRSAPTIEGAMRHKRQMNMLGVNYRSSPIVLDAFTQAEPGNAYGVLEEGVLVAGDRAFDATELRPVVAQAAGGVETGETRLFDVFGPIYHAVLVFTPDVASSTDVLDVLRRYPKDVIRPLIMLPQGAEMITGTQADILTGYTWRRKGEMKMVVVRPDGVVGAVVHGADGVGAYFARIFVQD